MWPIPAFAVSLDDSFRVDEQASSITLGWVLVQSSPGGAAEDEAVPVEQLAMLDAHEHLLVGAPPKRVIG